MNVSSGVPKFLTKIWALVEDPRNSNYICWSQDGNSFIVLDEGRFAKEILPKHFKHNNMASFVRQLNWYGFHKVMQDETGAARHDKYCSGRYQHQFFKRGQEELLSMIKRKVTPSTGEKRVFRKAKEETPECGEETCTVICTGQTIETHQCKTKIPVLQIEDGKTGPDDLQKILTFLHQLQARQDVLDTTVESLKRENEALWKEVLQLRPAQTQFEPVASSQSYDQMASLQTNQPLMIDSTGNYNQLSVSKTSQTVVQAFDNGWSTDRNSSRGIKRTVKEDIDSSAEEPNDHLLSISFHRSQEYDKYQTDDSDPSDVHSCQSDEMANEEDYSSNHSNSFAKIAENSMANRRKQVPHKRLKSSAERCVSATKAQNGSQWIGGSENEDEGNNCFVDPVTSTKI
ncbi:heat shock factor protein 2-like isoform X2 [Pseudophryne corroboree]|uniref:heat shock factor protein 2-like isoform X2 n=1 Tax=Pseudophryne corroboree TaxID=495146 RepID=UPI0030821D37